MASNSTEFCALDFSFYLGLNKEPIVKELAVVWYDDMRRQHWVFEPPYPENSLPVEIQEENAKKMLTIKYAWSDGDVPYDRLQGILIRCTKEHNMVYVNGGVRARHIANLIKKPVLNFRTLYNGVIFGINIDAIYPREYEFASTCIKHVAHKDFPFCSKARVTYLASILQKHSSAIRKGKALIQKILPNPITCNSTTKVGSDEDTKKEKGRGIEEGKENGKEGESEEEQEAKAVVDSSDETSDDDDDITTAAVSDCGKAHKTVSFADSI